MKKKFLLIFLLLTLTFIASFAFTGCNGCGLKSYRITITCSPEEGGSVTGQGTYKKGSTYILKATPNTNYVFDGWYMGESKLSGDLQFSGTMGAFNIQLTAKFNYNETNRTLTIHFKDDLGAKIAEDKIITKKKGESYNVAIENKVGYTVDKTSLSGVLNDNTTVTVTYTRKSYKLVINCKDENKDDLGNVENNFRYGDRYSFDLNGKIDYYKPQISNIEGIIDINNSLLAGQLNNSVLKIDATFIPKTYKINFKLIDENGEIISGQTQPSEYKKYLESYRFVPKDIDGWVKGVEFVEGTLTLNDALLGEQLTNKQNELTITFVYVSLTKPRTIPVKYVNAIGKKIKEDTSVTEEIGNNGEVDVIEIEDYFIDVAKMTEIYGEKFNSSENKLSFTMVSDKDFCITLYYKSKTVTLTINYLKEDGSVIANQYTQTIDYNSSYNVTSPTVKGYSPDKPVVSGTVQKADVSITVTYTAKKFKVTVNYYYKGTTTVASPQKVFNSVAFGSTFTLASPEIEGYKPDIAVVNFVLNEENDKTINVYYEAQSYRLTVKYVSDVEGFTCPATVTKILKYNESYEVVSPQYYGLSASPKVVSGKKKAYDEEITVTYSIGQFTVWFNYFYENKKVGTNYFGLSFNNKSHSIGVSSVIINDGLGYKINYTSFEAMIIYQNNQTSIKVYGIKKDSSKIDLTNTINDKAFDSGFVECNITAEKIMSTVTLNYICEGNRDNVLVTTRFTKQYGEVITIDKTYAVGYVYVGDKTKYKFTDKDETLYLDCISVEKTVKVLYFDDAGNEISPSVKNTYKYNEQFNIVSPTFDCYVPDETVIKGTVQLSNLTFIVTYTVQWDVDDNNALIIDSVDDLVELSKHPILWNRDITITKDLDLSSTALTPIGNNETVFSGNVIGNRSIIKNLSITNENLIKKTSVVNGENVVYGYAGLFGCLSGSVSDLTIENAIINVDLGITTKTTLYGGILCGLYSNDGTVGTISNVNVSGTITVNAYNCVVGGIIGFNSDIDSEISNCTATVTINNGNCNYAQVGGISGYEVMSNIHDCTVTLTTTFVEGANVFVGGIAGESVNGVIHTNKCNVSNVCGKQNNTIIY